MRRFAEQTANVDAGERPAGRNAVDRSGNERTPFPGRPGIAAGPLAPAA